jgi:transcription-repair coupling factor (superfamily II helicase)
MSDPGPDWIRDERFWDDVFSGMLDHLARERRTRVGGLGGSSASLAVAAAHRLAGPTILLVGGTTRAESVRDDLRALLGDVLYFPPYETLPWEGEPAHQGVVSDRVECLSALKSGEPGHVVVVPASALIKRVPPPEEHRTLALARGGRLSMDLIEKWLVSAGFERESAVYEQARWSRRGGIVDIGSYGMENPVRLELSGDVIESIRLFDQHSQRSIREVEEVRILPAREAFLSPDHWNRAVESIDQGHPLARKLWTATGFPGIEHYLPLFHDHLGTVFDYLHSIGTLVLLEPDDVLARACETIEYQRDSFPSEWLPFDFHDLFVSTAEVRSLMESAERSLSLELVPEQSTDVYYATLPQDSFVGHREEMVRQFESWLREGYTVSVCCDSAAEKRTFTDLLPPGMEVDVSVLSLSDGFRMPKRGIAVLVERKLLSGRRRPERVRRFKGGEVVTSYDDLVPGQFVVHADHGIGLFQGLERVTTGGRVIDCLAIEYAEADRVLVPMNRISDVQKYMAPGEHEPKLDRLGTGFWRRRVGSARRRARDVAGKLAVIYAERKANRRPSLPPPGPRMRSLEESFPYEETPDQAKTISSVKSDLLEDRPMDRLVCGDVGYGKTEVAVRASYRVVEAGRQVAVLVPTTVLAEQHYNTFRDRLAELPLEIRLLSRFQTPAEQRKIAAELAEGKADVVIGTHRLIQKDVRFDNLGLLIVDEEHRFGVRQKEYLRELRTTVDTLSLTATPIPRTLHMALSGFRDISMIASPPRDRYPIQTELINFNEGIIARAIRRELEREGQVFFVHNRIRSIEKVKRRLQGFLPDVEIGVAHGRMPPSSLESVMHEFLQGKYDVLLCTSIIESGLDLPRVNTIFVDQAHMFGLADLYQLRGRVGRSHRRAYCYLIHPGRLAALKPAARGRMEAIKRYVDLGSGWHIAMRDLEIRGAGELLGASQHGHMESIGYSMFVHLIAEEVQRLRGARPASRASVRVELQGGAYIPVDYVPDLVDRVRLYRYVWRASEEPEIDSWLREVRDRFGVLPEPVLGTALRARIHLLAREAGAEEVTGDSRTARMVFPPGYGKKRLLQKAMSQRESLLTEKTGRMVLVLDLAEREGDEGLERVCDVLRILR